MMNAFAKAGGETTVLTTLGGKLALCSLKVQIPLCYMYKLSSRSLRSIFTTSVVADGLLYK